MDYKGIIYIPDSSKDTVVPEGEFYRHVRHDLLLQHIHGNTYLVIVRDVSQVNDELVQPPLERSALAAAATEARDWGVAGLEWFLQQRKQEKPRPFVPVLQPA